jgi:hypothetical protein
MTRVIVGAAAVALMLTGCVSSPSSERWVFQKSDTTDAQTKRDQSECFTRSMDTDTPVAGGMPRVDRDAYRACMEARGYQASRATP